jgi:hypothetical protein
MWSDPIFVRAFISCLADLQSSPDTALAESQTACISDACSTLLNLITHLRDASGLPGSNITYLLNRLLALIRVNRVCN